MAQRPTISVSRPESNVVLFTLDLPDKSANILSAAVLDEFEARLNELEKSRDVDGLIIASGKPGIFIAGADLREFVASFGTGAAEITAMCRRGQTLFSRLSKLPFVTVAAIDGVCLGGGAELAIWCDHRILSDSEKTQFGFPEVKLGLFPGWGGTARASRMIGLANAVELVTSGEPIDAKQAVQLGLAVAVAPAAQLLAAAMRLVREEAATKKYLQDRERLSRPIENISETELTFLGVTASAYIRSQTHDQYPAPMAALELMLAAAGVDLETACRMEAEAMPQLFGTPINRALVNVFFLTDRNKKDPGVDTDVPPREIKRVGVVGAGIMGSGIVAANLRRDVTVTLGDAVEGALHKGAQAALDEAAYDKNKKGPDVDRLLDCGSRLHLATGDEAFRQCDLLIEAIVENAQVKRQLLQRLEAILPEGATIASNTSTIPITSLAEALKRPARFVGIHFFNPVRRMRLVEVIRGRETDDATVATAVAYAKRLGKMPIVINDGPGFLVNRLLFPYMNEALELISEGIEINAIERAAKSFGMPMGPIELYDMVGLDTAFYAGKTMWEAFPQRIIASPILPALVKAGRLGKKSGRGFFLYDKANKKKADRPQPDPELGQFIAPFVRKKEKFTQEQLQHRLFLPMLLEATRVVEEGLVRDVRDVDLGLIFGLGFPAFRGGLLFWADEVGAAQIVEWLKPLEAYGERTRPTPLLLEMARSGRKFYE
jgi:3-hydroxyacyl-CoA dehydrogenase/enoyl-CoA hydratase/3-hydroxybutyryl-CoA epimerase/3-hydroxyacyl-CoA dehydrogenase/enoyl-CoA hydratase/3-hydroxybutyryl-CoA epimerase/enoyl-CoA isomerase